MSSDWKQNSSSKGIFWQSWQKANTHLLTPDYHIEGYIVDFVHIPTKTIIEVDFVVQEPIRQQLKFSGWHIAPLHLKEIERDVQACVQKISKLLTNRAIYLQKKEGTNQEKPLERPREPAKITILRPRSSQCRECGSEIPSGFQLCNQCRVREKIKSRQLPIIRWAKEVMARPDLIVLDTETTDVNQWGEVIEIAIVDRNGTPLVNTLIKPRRPIPSKVTKIHGITNEEVKEALRFDDIWPEIEIYFQKNIVLAYNVAFDLRILANTARRFNIPFPENIRSSCIMHKYTAYLRAENEEQRHSLPLETACEHFDIQAGDHRALADAVAAWNVLKKLSEQG